MAASRILGATLALFAILLGGSAARAEPLPWRIKNVQQVAPGQSLGVGSIRYPMFSFKKRASGVGGQMVAVSTSTKLGGDQIEYEDQDPRVHRKWLEAIAKNGVKSEMGDTFDEAAIMALPPEKLTGKIHMPVILDNIS